MRRDKAVLIKQAQEGIALDQLKTQAGYKNLLDIFNVIYLDAWEKLEESENEVARAQLKAIKDIVHQIDDKIKLGEDARKQLSQLSETAQASSEA